MKTDFETLKKKILKFRDDRDWKQFHNPKNLALSISIEASELMELYQWLNMQESREFSETNKKEIESEVADILNYLILFANDLDIDLLEVTDRKLRVNKKKYPVKKAKGNSTKYNRYKKRSKTK
ncbi:MAG: nucleotide pyrophosphohydrolase [Candidatus Dojkabacteria bacterium]|jgi:NTP pyrophosphatase (non-canonical NTP hydrolase)